MANRWRAFPIAIAGGLQDSKPIPEPGDLSKLDNFAAFRGRFALRAPMVETCRFKDDQGTPAFTITHVLAACYHAGKMYVLGYSNGQTDVYLYRLEPTGKAESGDPVYPDASPVAVVWTGVSSNIPKPVMVGIEGGTATARISRVYICDYDQNYVTRVWDEDGDSIANLTSDFDDDDAKENVYFHYVFPYQFHLWGAGFYQGDEFPATQKPRPELLRFSQPGLIATNEPGTTYSNPREWWTVDHRAVGSRGDKITCISTAGGMMVVFKRREVYAIQGFDSESWAGHQLSNRVGAVGPYAAAATDDGYCFFWSERGPHVIDPNGGITDIGEPIRRRVIESALDELISVEYSADDGIVYFTRVNPGNSTPDRYLAFDKVHNAWMSGQWLANDTNAAEICQLKAIPSDALPGPIGPPTSPSATAQSDTKIRFAWTAGDTALDTTTEVHGSQTPSFTPGPGNLLDTIPATQEYYDHTGLSSKATWYYKCRHVRNGQGSAYCSEVSDKTWLQEPTAFDAMDLPSGIKITLYNNEDGADIKIYRKQLTPTEGEWVLAQTLASQTTGTKTWDDTGVSCGEDYRYRAKATKAGETDSEWTPTDDNEACKIPPDLLTVTHDSVELEECADESTDSWVSYTCQYVDEDDTVKIYRGIYTGSWAYTLIYSGPLLTSDTKNDRLPYERNFVAYTDDFPSGNLLTSEGQTTQVNLSPGNPYSNKVNVSYEVHLDVMATGTGDCQLYIEVAIDAWYNSQWNEEVVYDYYCWSLDGNPATCDWNDEEKAVTCGGLPTKIRLRLKDVSIFGSADYADVEVHGFNLPTDSDPDYGVKYNVQEGGSTIKTKYKVEAYDGGVTLSETMYSSEETINNVTVCS